MADEIEKKLAKDQWLGGAQPSAADREAIDAMPAPPSPATHPNTFAWWCLAAKFNPAVRATWAGAAPAAAGGKKGGKKEEPKKAAAPKKEEPKKADDDDFDPFADDDDGETLEEQQARFDKVAAEAKAKKGNKPGPIAKSLVVWDVKPWGEETDLDAMAREILKIEQDGLFWKTEYKKEPVAFGIEMIRIGATIEDEKVSSDDVQEKIEALEDYVQSVDIFTFQKI